MRIGVVGPVSPDSFADNMIDSLRRMGHETVGMGDSIPSLPTSFGKVAADIARKATRLESAVQRRLVSAAKRERLQLIVTVDASLLPTTVQDLKETGAKVVLWFPDHVSNLGRLLMFIGPYDAVFVKEPLLVERSRKTLDVPIHYLPEACNPSWHRPIDGEPRAAEVVIAGSFHSYRVRLLERLLNDEIPLRLYGPRLPRWLHSDGLAACHSGRYLVREEKSRVFRSAGVVLNTLHPAEVEGVNCRLFESAASGGAVLTEYRRELPNLFSVDTEVLSFSRYDELVEKCRWLLSHPNEGRELGDAATKRAHEQHTYEERFREIFSKVNMHEV